MTPMPDANRNADRQASPVERDDLFVMRRGRREVVCRLFPYPDGWELRLLIGPRGDVMLQKRCSSREEVLSAAEQWKTAMTEKGWM